MQRHSRQSARVCRHAVSNNAEAYERQPLQLEAMHEVQSQQLQPDSKISIRQ